MKQPAGARRSFCRRKGYPFSVLYPAISGRVPTLRTAATLSRRHAQPYFNINFLAGLSWKAENRLISAGVSRWFLSVRSQISMRASKGTKNLTFASILMDFDWIRKPVAAFMRVLLGKFRHPPHRPMLPVFIVAQAEAAPAHIQWRVIAAVAGYAAQTRVFIKAVTAAGVANQTETIPLPR